MRKFCLVMLFAAALGGCANRPADYVSGNASPETFEQQSADCEMRAAESRTMYGMGGLAGVAAFYASYNEVFDACMRSKGLKRKEA